MLFSSKFSSNDQIFDFMVVYKLTTLVSLTLYWWFMLSSSIFPFILCFTVKILIKVDYLGETLHHLQVVADFPTCGRRGSHHASIWERLQALLHYPTILSNLNYSVLTKI